MDAVPVGHLGYDQVLSILRLLPAEAVLSFAATCRAFRDWASSDVLWEALCRRDWGARAAAAALADWRCGVPWRRLYAEVARLSALQARRLQVKGTSPRPRASHSINLVAGWLVVFGGGCEGGRHLDDIWATYVGNRAGTKSSNALTWQQLASGTPSGRFGHSCILVGDALVLFGGINDRGLRLDDTWIGQITCEEPCRMRISWRLLEIGPLAPSPRGAHAACCIDDKFIVIHGGIGVHGSRLGDTWLLDLSDGLQSGSWRRMGDTGPLPSARSGHTLTWIGELPSPRAGHSATFLFGGKILVYGGEDKERRRMDDFWILDIPALLQFESGNRKVAKRMWKKLRIDGQSPNCRSFHGACVDTSGYCVYVFGGMVDALLHPAESLGLRFDGQLYQVELVLHL
ncbi:unnamed protein product [Triticum turgidum subsp. durum]|uniref:F-box domain-containing protein n=1 Tax=Triticum turgidum subsp. durum TaxID=4567 RepID=A0A9R1A1Y9_TRITD|nr:unnamed protein product [Triticum turgidum subsp. durum]